MAKNDTPAESQPTDQNPEAATPPTETTAEAPMPAPVTLPPGVPGEAPAVHPATLSQLDVVRLAQQLRELDELDAKPAPDAESARLDCGHNVLLYYGKMFGPNVVTLTRSSLPDAAYEPAGGKTTLADHVKALEAARVRVDRERMIRQGLVRSELGENAQYMRQADLEVPIHKAEEAVPA